MHHSSEDTSRRGFLREFGAGALGAMAFAAGQSSAAPADSQAAKVAAQPEPAKPVSDRKVRMAIVGHGVCGFGASLGFQHHPNVEIVAVSDLVPERRSALAKICACEKTYDSLEVLVKDPAIEAVCLATDAPSHARHAVEVMKHGKHCVTAVPAAMTLDDCQAVKEAKEKSGLKYMMAETSYYHGEVIRSRNLYRLGEKLLYTEGHYYHHGVTRLGSWKNWRRALPPMYYPTHSTAYYVGVSGKRLTQVSCLGYRGPGEEWQKNDVGQQPVRQRVGPVPHQRGHDVPDQRVLVGRLGRRRERELDLGEARRRRRCPTACRCPRACRRAATAARTARWPTSSSWRCWRTASRRSTCTRPWPWSRRASSPTSRRSRAAPSSRFPASTSKEGLDPGYAGCRMSAKSPVWQPRRSNGSEKT